MGAGPRQRKGQLIGYRGRQELLGAPRKARASAEKKRQCQRIEELEREGAGRSSAEKEADEFAGDRGTKEAPEN
ncbi:hypothetical protein NDU88_006975 [Pleurodeles waltl]|uniref:Uncharacterized protein n=1 Tax=Pleurodeles waltl TaxID=8319 RepID=A0AAV7PQ19_PLEWA|nr:hypothetical protein NDU88_006975 [Pleurodeles waltl]